MALFNLTYKSMTIGNEISLNILIPQEKHIISESTPEIKKNTFDTNYPLLFLLHDETDPPTDWLRMTSLERYSNQNKIAIVMPNCHRSFFTNYATRDGLKKERQTNIADLQNFTELAYEDFIIFELINYIRKLFPITSERKKTYIGGKGMGGFGAFKIGLKHNDIFSKIFSIDGLLDLQWAMDNIKEKEEQFIEIFGNLKINEDSENNFSHMLGKTSKNINRPEIKVIWFKNSIYGSTNNKLKNKTNGKYNFIEWLEEKEPLTWKQIDIRIEKILSWLNI